MLLLDSVTFDPNIVYDILATIVIFCTGIGFFFNSRSKIELVRNDLENTKKNLEDLKKSVNDTYTKIENKIAELENKINDLPSNIIELFKQLK